MNNDFVILNKQVDDLVYNLNLTNEQKKLLKETILYYKYSKYNINENIVDNVYTIIQESIKGYVIDNAKINKKQDKEIIHLTEILNEINDYLQPFRENVAVEKLSDLNKILEDNITLLHEINEVKNKIKALADNIIEANDEEITNLFN